MGAGAAAAGTMTERRSAALWVVTAAGALFAVVLVLLALQMRAGGDPALGAGAPVAATPPKPRPVLIRKVIVRRVIEEPAEPAAAVPAPAPAAAAASGGGTAAAPAAPAPAPAAPAPAPAPAPVTTGAS
jgi:hypothetical protein